MIGKDLAVLILSCDKFSDTWGPCLRQFRRFFPDGFKIYLGSNTVPCQDAGVTPVLSGPDADWSTSCKRILAQIQEPKLFVVVEDYFLASQVDPEAFSSALSFLFDRDAMHVKFWALPMALPATDDPRVGVYPKGAPYRATVCGFWDRRYLMDLLIEGENPWNFEILGSYRTSYRDGFYGLTRPLCSFRNMIEKGRWIPASVQWARAEGIGLSLDKRPLLKNASQFMSRTKMLYFNAMTRIPWHWRVWLMAKLRLALVSY
jgi:hypothetical protein